MILIPRPTTCARSQARRRNRSHVQDGVERTAPARRAKRNFRSKTKGDRYERPPANAAPPPPTDAPSIAPTVTQSGVEDVTHPARNAPVSRRAAEHHRIDRLTLLSALALSTVSAGFSIYGFTSIFVGAFWSVIGMGVALELGKLRAVTWIGRNGSTPWWGLKGALAALVIVLMGLNVVGVFGFLAKAHIGHQVEGDIAVAGRAADIEARLAVQAEKVADLDAARTIETPSAGNLRTASAINAQAAALTAAAKLRAADDERRQAKRTSLADKLTVEAKALADLKIEKAKVDGDRKVAEADLGPVRYLATLLGAGDQDVLRWFILVIALLLDPAAVLLLLTATRR